MVNYSSMSSTFFLLGFFFFFFLMGCTSMEERGHADLPGRKWRSLACLGRMYCERNVRGGSEACTIQSLQEHSNPLHMWIHGQFAVKQRE